MDAAAASEHVDRVAPPDLEPLRMFLNSDNRFFGVDYFDEPDRLHRYLRGEKILGEEDRIETAGLVRLRAFRDALRAFLGEPGPAVSETLNVAAAGFSMVVEVGPAGEVELTPVARDDLVARIAAASLAAVHRAVLDGRWARLHICQRPDCQWIYYDSSRNKSARWCSADPCGDVMKARAWRARQRGHTEAS
ncbi:CGNR zinc finger domain-containing protein [Nakamurella silvestris]|nr:CGNR zinc finger domain-containing protein [Nakamurella silvestris]